MISTKEEALSALKALDEDLKKITPVKKTNIFDAVGMKTQEIKHSAFLAWLLDPASPHGLGSVFLSDFLKALWEYPPHSDAEIAANRDILQNDNFDELLNATDIKVETEKTLNGPESRIDVFIRSQSANTTLVIENKVFTSTHDDQLKRYENEVAALGGNKILVYLTPKGDIPTDVEGNYQEGWCIFSYEKLLDVFKKRLRALPKSRQYDRLKFLLEDYIDMVDTVLLQNNPELRVMCKELLKKHAEALEILMEYNDNVDEVYAYIAEQWIPAHVPNAAIVEHKGRQLRFCTQTIADFYAKYNAPVQINPAYWAIQAGLNSKDGPIIFGFGLGKNPDAKWTEADVIVRDLLLPDKKMGSRFCSLFGVQLLSAAERQLKFEVVKPQIDKQLDLFLQTLNGFEKKLLPLLNS